MAPLKKRLFKKEKSRLVYWLREGKGKRLTRLDSGADYAFNNEIVMFNVEVFQAKAISNYIVLQEFPHSEEVEQDLNQALTLISLPQLVLMQICDNLYVQDILNLRDINDEFRNFINHIYVPRLSLPLLPDTYMLIGKKRILSLTSCCNLAWLPGIRDFEPFKALNLGFVRELKLTGNNLNWYECTLSKSYTNSLRFLLQSIKKTSLSFLEIHTDVTAESLSLLNMLKAFKNLEELVIHRHGNNNSKTKEKKSSEKNSLECVLAVTALKRLKLIWDNHQAIYIEGFMFESDSLEELVLEGKHVPLHKLRLPQLQAFTIDAMLFTLYNNKQEVAQIVLDGCPKLKLFNDIDVEAIGKDVEKLPDLCNLLCFGPI